MSAKHRLVGIQAARGAAALLVVFYHAGRMLSLDQYVGSDPLGGLFNFGHAGVDFFFVLSGFIIYFVHHEDIDTPRHVPRYAWRRIVRIYPIYWIVTLGAVVLAVAAKHTDLSVHRLVASVLLLPQAEDPIVGVAWTLEHEVVFYFVFAVLIISRRIGLLVSGAWLILTVVGAVRPMSGVLLPFLSSPYHFDFLFGILSAFLVLRDKVPMPRLVASLGLLGFVAAAIVDDRAMIDWSGLLDKAFFGVASGVLIAGIAAAEREGTLRFGVAAEFFGGMSYSLYLVHTTFIGLTAHALMSASVIGDFPGPVVEAFCITVALSGAAAVYAFVEQPMLARVQSIGKKYRRGVKASAASGSSGN